MGKCVKINFIFLTLCFITIVGIPETFAKTVPGNVTKESPYFRIPAARYSANKITKPHHSMYFSPFHHMKNMKKFADDAHKKHSDRMDTMEQDPKNNESSFQISGKLLLAELYHFLFFDTISLYFAGNFGSYWQTYVKDPFFRDNDYKPQVFIEFPFHAHTLHVGWVHQSNGKGLPEGVELDENSTDRERSWDRLYASFQTQRHRASFFCKVWYIFPNVKISYRKNSSSIQQAVKITTAEGPKYNRDIAEFMGFGKVGFVYDFSPQHRITLTKQLSPKHWDKTWQVEYLAPVPFLPAFQFIVKYFKGYGATITNYKDLTENWTVGLVLNYF